MMRFRDTLTVLIISLFLLSFFAAQPAQSFIEREYTMREVVDACTNIVFGEVKSIDKRRMTGIVQVKEDVKGKSRRNEIKMNFSTGQYKRGTSPQKLLSLLKPGMPIIVFYREHYGIDSMCFIDETWFQMRAHGGRSTTSWWSFTHIDPMMSRTFDGTTKTFQKLVRDMLAGKMWVGAQKNTVKVLVLTGNSTSPTWGQTPVHTNTVTYEYQALRSAKKVGKQPVAYEATKSRKLPNLAEADILWIGYEEISSFGRYLLTRATEQKIKKFVKDGGIAIVSGQDSTPKRACGIGWLEGKLKGVESRPTQKFIATKNAGTLFSTPNKIVSGKIYVDDAWTDWEKQDEIFAITQENKELVAGMRRHGKGLYIITSLRNDDRSRAFINKDFMENIIHYAVGQLKEPPKK